MVVSRVQPLLIKCGGGGEASGDSGHTFVSLRNSIKRKVTCNYEIFYYCCTLARGDRARSTQLCLLRILKMKLQTSPLY